MDSITELTSPIKTLLFGRTNSGRAHHIYEKANQLHFLVHAFEAPILLSHVTREGWPPAADILELPYWRSTFWLAEFSNQQAWEKVCTTVPLDPPRWESCVIEGERVNYFAQPHFLTLEDMAPSETVDLAGYPSFNVEVQ